MSIQKAFKNQLDQAQLKLEAKFGEFLSSGQKISDLRSRATEQSNSDKTEVRIRAEGLTNKSNALLKQYENIKQAGQDTMGKIMNLKTSLDSRSTAALFDPGLANVLHIIELLAKKKSEIFGAVADSVNVMGRMQTHLVDTNGLSQDVQNLENYSQGKGFSAFTDKIGSGVTNLYGPVLKIATVGLLAYFLLPSLITRMARRK